VTETIAAAKWPPFLQKTSAMDGMFLFDLRDLPAELLGDRDLEGPAA
jgi:hypothetical protein